MQFFEPIRAFAIREADVQENEIETILAQALFGRGERRRRQHLAATLSLLCLEAAADHQVVLDYNDFLNGHKERASELAYLKPSLPEFARLLFVAPEGKARDRILRVWGFPAIISSPVGVACGLEQRLQKTVIIRSQLDRQETPTG